MFDESVYYIASSKKGVEKFQDIQSKLFAYVI